MLSAGELFYSPAQLSYPLRLINCLMWRSWISQDMQLKVPLLLKSIEGIFLMYGFIMIADSMLTKLKNRTR